jgi:cholestenol delta-isomerase
MDPFVSRWYSRIVAITHLVSILSNIRLFEKYSALDLRYPLKEPTLMTVSAIEFFFMGPMCVWIALRLKFNKDPILTNYLIGITSFV